MRFPSKADQAFVSWIRNGVALTFGLEAASFRFRMELNPPAVAPELDKYTRGATVNKWTCVEIEMIASTLQATVTEFGDAPFKLTPVGGTADAGIDETFLEAIPGQTPSIDQAIWSLGDMGTDIEIDDVRVVGAGLGVGLQGLHRRQPVGARGRVAAGARAQMPRFTRGRATGCAGAAAAGAGAAAGFGFSTTAGAAAGRGLAGRAAA